MDLLSLLRERTREQHARLDGGIDFRGGDITAERYCAFLRGVLAVVRPLEPAIESWLGPAPGDARRKRLTADLARMRDAGAADDIRVRLPRSLGEAYGCAYVLEGSALGGLVLAPAVEAALGPAAATSYLRLRGPDTGRAWRAWLARLAEFGRTATANDVRAACDLACATFQAYESSLRTAGALVEVCECRP